MLLAGIFVQGMQGLVVYRQRPSRVGASNSQVTMAVHLYQLNPFAL